MIRNILIIIVFYFFFIPPVWAGSFYWDFGLALMNEKKTYGILSNAGGYFESKTYQGSRLDIPTQRRGRRRSVQKYFREPETLNC